MTEVDWASLMPRLRAGHWTCDTHGLITQVDTGVVPACPSCRQAAYRVAFDRHGLIRFVEPVPAHCAGPGRHRLGLGEVRLGWVSCQCRPAVGGNGGHRSWACRACADVQLWPPCEGDTTSVSSFRL